MKQKTRFKNFGNIA